MVFWQHDPSCSNGEWWLSPKQFAAKKVANSSTQTKKRADLAVMKASLPTKLRRGDTREDGMVFLCYATSCTNGEWWITSEAFAAKKAKEAKKNASLSAKKAALPIKLSRGDIGEDGKLFWQYSVSHANGEHWLTPEAFAAKKDKINKSSRNRYATDPLYAIKYRLRCRVAEALKHKGLRKNAKTEALLGCTYEEFRAHIERLFLPGMSWANFSKCHIDHIVPLDAADTEADVYALNHYTNLRPMWGPENIAKSDTLPEEHELPDNLHPKVKEIYLTAKKKLLDKAAQQGKL